MGIRRVASLTARRIVGLPGIRPLFEAAYERRFARVTPSGNLYRGVFADFAQAGASAPSTRPLGYDNQASAGLYRDRTRRVYISDYPVMLWLGKLFDAGNASVFDLGGHIGIAYYAYQRYLRYPDALRWRVFDVASVTAAGAAWAREHDAQQRLTFTEQRADANGCDILLASGSLQYLDYTLCDLLDTLPQPPRHLIVNLLPVHMSEAYFTLQNMGTAYCPYRITAEREFVDALKARSYVQQDRWENPDRTCRIPFHPAHSLDRYFGFCFSRES